MDLPDPYLPGALSLLELLDKKMLVVLRDGRKLIGCLRSIDQFANLVLDEVVERTFMGKNYSDIRHGFLLIRGENVVLAGEIDDTRETGLTEITVEEMRQMEEERTNRKHGDEPKPGTSAVKPENDLEEHF